jgi:intracellular sulfur oxidation DsrE/DsrF family protein
MRGTSLLLGLVLAGMTYFAQAATPATSPAHTIAMHGKAIVLPDAAHQPDPKMRQRAVFSLTVAPASPAATDPGLERVARAVNLLKASGVTKKQLDFVVLLSEGATDSALADPAYRVRHGVANPNLGLIAQLSAAGVQMFVCGQALHSRQLDSTSLAPSIAISLSALTSIITLQQQGYALVPL